MATGKHLKIEFSKAGNNIKAVLFSCTAADFPYEKGDVVDLAVSVKRNEYLGRVSVNIIIKNIRFNGTDEDRILTEFRLFERLIRGENIYKDDAFALLPQRELMANVYRFLRSREFWSYGEEVICKRIGEERYGAVCVSIRAMLEMGLLAETNGVLVVNKTTEKVNLEQAPVILKLKSFIEGVEK